jgi:hypothetical protein
VCVAALLAAALLAAVLFAAVLLAAVLFVIYLQASSPVRGRARRISHNDWAWLVVSQSMIVPLQHRKIPCHSTPTTGVEGYRATPEITTSGARGVSSTEDGPAGTLERDPDSTELINFKKKIID